MESDLYVRMGILEERVETMSVHLAEQITECKQSRKDLTDTLAGITKRSGEQLDTLRDAMVDMRIAVAKTSVVIGAIVVMANLIVAGIVGAIMKWAIQ